MEDQDIYISPIVDDGDDPAPMTLVAVLALAVYLFGVTVGVAW